MDVSALIIVSVVRLPSSVYLRGICSLAPPFWLHSTAFAVLLDRHPLEDTSVVKVRATLLPFNKTQCRRDVGLGAFVVTACVSIISLTTYLRSRYGGTALPFVYLVPDLVVCAATRASLESAD